MRTQPCSPPERSRLALKDLSHFSGNTSESSISWYNKASVSKIKSGDWRLEKLSSFNRFRRLILLWTFRRLNCICSRFWNVPSVPFLKSLRPLILILCCPLPSVLIVSYRFCRIFRSIARSLFLMTVIWRLVNDTFVACMIYMNIF